MSRLTRSGRNMGYNVLGWVITIGLNFVATPFLLNRLGPEAFGIAALVLLVIGYFSIMDLGIDIAGVKLLAEYHAKRDWDSLNRLMGVKLQFYTGIGLLGMVLMAGVAAPLATRVFAIPPAMIPQAIIVFRLAGLALFANMLLTWGTVVPQGLQRYDVLNKITMLTAAGTTGASVAAVYAGYGVVGFVSARVVATFAAVLITVIAVQKLVPTLSVPFRVDAPMWRRVWDITAYGVFIRLIGVVGGSVDRTLVGMWRGAGALAAYAIPHMVATSISQLLLRMVHFVFPMASEMTSSGRTDEFRAIFLRVSRFVVALGSLTVLPMIVLAGRFLALWVGSDMAARGTDAFRLLLLSAYLGTIVLLLSHVLAGAGFIRQFTWIYAGRTFFLVGACVVLIRFFGITGAAAAVALAAGLDLILAALSFKRYLNVPVGRYIEACLRPVLLGLALLLALALIVPYVQSWLNFATALGGYGLAYVGLAFRIGIFGEAEKTVIVSLTRLRRSD